MKDETALWLKYADENLSSAKILVNSRLFNPCLQNIQQAVEKTMKALMTEKSLQLIKTHSISELNNILKTNSVSLELSDDECEFLDSIYLPSKYPVSSVLPYYEPDASICNQGIYIAERLMNEIKNR